MKFLNKAILLALALIVCGSSSASANNIALAIDLFTPSFRTGSNTTWTGWDTFDDIDPNATQLIGDSTPDLGNDPGTFFTTNAEDHLSGSGNFYSGSGSVAEDITFSLDPGAGGFTTVIVQAKTLFGGFGPRSISLRSMVIFLQKLFTVRMHLGRDSSL